MAFRSRLHRAALFVLVLIGAAFGLFTITARFGLVTGEEFSPYTFQRRIYSYHELPLIHLQISPVTREVQRHPLEEMLFQEHVPRPKSASQRWDLVAARRGGSPWRQGEAQILCQYLDARTPDNNGARFWKTWTSEHPTLANILWPAIAQLARRQLYACIPPLFNAAQSNRTPKEFQETLDGLLSRCYQRVATIEMELGHWEEALELYRAALNHQPTNKKSLQGQAKCYQKLGEAAASTQTNSPPSNASSRH
ncbi:MAG: tetratricopeptide repeat protein [Planctomycetota bacterium]